MTFQIIATFTITISLLIGTIFTLVAGVGLIKLDTSMSRLHAPTKAGTVGIGAFLFASMIHAWTFSQGSFHELLIMGFLFVTAPVSANFMAKVNIHRGAC
ncbi:MAG: multicomponent K+:H+ antiporter subunit G, partial [Yoonia sp.]